MQARRSPKPARRGRGREPQGGDFWRLMPEPPPPDAIVPADDPTALLRSLGPPPLGGQSTVGDHYLIAVVERAARLANALAAAAQLTAEHNGDGHGAEGKGGV